MTFENNSAAVSIFPFLSPSDRIWTYWNGLRTSGPIPCRRNVRPFDLGSSLDFAFIAEKSAFCGAKFRVCGDAVNDVLGMDVRGMPVASMLTTSVRDQFVGHLESVFIMPTTFSAELHSSGRYGAPALTAEFVMLPMLDDSGCVTRALGGLILNGEIGEQPRYFDSVTDVVFDPLGDQSRQTTISPVAKEKAAQKGRPHLTLVR